MATEKKFGELHAGLNYLPTLTESSSSWTSLCSRSRLNGPFRGSALSLQKAAMLYYNGNYEGDSTMFGDIKRQRITDIVDDFSDNDYKKDLVQFSNVEEEDIDFGHESECEITSERECGGDVESKCVRKVMSAESNLRNQWQRLWNAYKCKFISAERSNEIAEVADKIQKNIWCRTFCTLLSYTYGALAWLLCLLVSGVVCFATWSYGLWKSRLVLRNSARRLLWLLTVAKCGDIPLFTLILFTSPLLFGIALCGLFISLYCVIKDWIFRHHI